MPSLRARAVALVLVAILLVSGAALVRASAWTPVAPAALPVAAWSPTVVGQPNERQTLDNLTFEAAGGAFVAELLGFRRLTSGALHAFDARIVRVGGEPVSIEVSRASLDGNPMLRATQRAEDIEIDLEFFPAAPTTYSIAAEIDLRAWRPVAWGYVEEPVPRVRLTAQIERADAPPP